MSEASRRKEQMITLCMDMSKDSAINSVTQKGPNEWDRIPHNKYSL